MQTFATLLDTLNAASAARKPAIEQMIMESFQRRKAVLALDMSGFTLTVRREGILAYLCQIRRMQQLTRPLVLAYQGQVVKNEADNLLAVFDDPAQAVEAAMAMVKASQSVDTRLAADGVVLAPIAFSIGVDFGEILLIDGVDCFGDAVNLAYKLGEDIARPGEILVTQRLREALGAATSRQLTPVDFSVGGVEVLAYVVAG
ncbi:MAG: adenylate/guanylate cyclase [Burkholderiales bacterium PBB4]|nr:MAG: adenylate/guanylate cyclase [Burkholderiales bacterium PBB4]